MAKSKRPKKSAGKTFSSRSTKKKSPPRRRTGAQAAEQKPKSLNSPSLRTVKRLFAVSQNQCAFPQCTTPMVDKTSSSVLGQICHIKGEKCGSARFDEDQPDAERQGFDNLILLCGSHHKIIDDDEVKYTVRRLRKMKKDHENPRGRMRLTDSQAKEMIVKIAGNTLTDGSIISTANQSGGQTAHIINNYGDSADEDVNIEATLSVSGGLELIKQFGSPGVVLKIICRSKRPAKIRNASLCKEGRGFLAKFAQAFGTELPHSPPPGPETETLFIELNKLTEQNTSEGHVLQRDDVCRFFLPLTTGGLGAFLAPPPESVTIRTEFFDDSERVLLQGQQIQELLRSLVKTYGKRPWESKGTTRVNVRVASTEIGDFPVSAIGTTNYKSLQLVDASELSQADRDLGTSVSCTPLIVCGPDEAATIGLAVGKPELQPVDVEDVTVTVIGFRADTKHLNIPFTELRSEQTPSEARVFFLPFERVPDVVELVQHTEPSSYGVSISSGKREMLVLPGQFLQSGVSQIREMPRTAKQDKQTRAKTKVRTKKKGVKRKKK